MHVISRWYLKYYEYNQFKMFLFLPIKLLLLLHYIVEFTCYRKVIYSKGRQSNTTQPENAE